MQCCIFETLKESTALQQVLYMLSEYSNIKVFKQANVVLLAHMKIIRQAKRELPCLYSRRTL